MRSENDYNNTNFWDVLVTLSLFAYLLVILGGTVYIVQFWGWSPWWFIVSLSACSVHIKTGHSKKNDEEIRKAVDEASNKLIKERIESENYHSERMVEWVRAGAKNAVTSFTSGPQRQIAYAVENLVMEIRRGVK